MSRIVCPLCIAKTGVQRTVPEQRHATVLPFTFADTSVEVIPCALCRDEFLVLSLRIRKSRALALEGAEAVVRHADGLVEFS